MNGKTILGGGSVDDDKKLRLRASTMLAKFWATPKGRAAYKKLGLASAPPVVIALESDAIREVIGRAQRYAPPASIAVFFPGRPGLALLTIEPVESDDTTPEPERVGGDSTIGMLIGLATVTGRSDLAFALWKSEYVAHHSELIDA